jgi:hypothetical protein
MCAISKAPPIGAHLVQQATALVIDNPHTTDLSHQVSVQCVSEKDSAYGIHDLNIQLGQQTPCCNLKDEKLVRVSYDCDWEAYTERDCMRCCVHHTIVKI